MSDMKELTDKQVKDGVAALDQMRERIIPRSYRTPASVFKYLTDRYGIDIYIEQVLMWDEKNEWVTFANYAVDGDGQTLGPPCNDTRPCPPCCPDCP